MVNPSTDWESQKFFFPILWQRCHTFKNQSSIIEEPRIFAQDPVQIFYYQQFPIPYLKSSSEEDDSSVYWNRIGPSRIDLQQRLPQLR
ncbi:hypothetical protein G4B88_015505 [Cannabis sativa]|uniref:Uncharacterized protein n=1 Tax=Cannabis sativa TaxID=3483 RepID=A0A7J6EFL5_CANSA|nr:hypothetical protein G4B88_012620 [Cannabis sativa]KAF4381239.1 hypothetical protein G4B88_015505 [Cannabis sativa]